MLSKTGLSTPKILFLTRESKWDNPIDPTFLNYYLRRYELRKRYLRRRARPSKQGRLVYINISYTFEGIFYGPVCTFEGIGNDKTRGQINSGIDLRPRSERRTVWCAMHAPRSARHGVVLHALCRISRSLSLLTRREPSLYLPSARFLFLRAFPQEFETVLSHLAERYKYNRLHYRWRYLYVRFSFCLTSSSVLDLRCEHLSMSVMDYLVFKVDYFKYHHRLARILEKFRVDWRINKQGEQEELTRKCFDPKVGDSLKRIISG